MNMQAFDPVEFEERISKLPMEQLIRQSAQTAELVKQNPKNFELRFSLALMLCRTEEYQGAVIQLKKAHKQKPNSEIILKTLCELLLLEQKKYGDALKYLKKWAFLRKDLAIIWTHIAECQMQLGKIDQAFESLGHAKRINPKEQEIYLVSADVHSKTGNAEAAMADARQALKIEKNKKAMARISGLPGFATDIEMVESVVHFADSSEDQNLVGYLYNQAASGFEELKEYDRAFEYYRKSNEEPSKHLDKESTLVGFSNVRETFSLDFIKSKQRFGHETDQPIFIVGMPRSGTTLTESILAGHPEILDNGELGYMHTKMKQWGLYTKVDPLLRQALPTMQKHFHDAPDHFWKNIAEGYMNVSGFNRKSSKRQVDKLPHNFMSVGLISIVFPNAKIIHCRRNPIDCALSCYKQSFSEFHSYATELEFLGLYYRQYWEMMNYWREILPGRMFEVYYEDTVANTEIVARNMIDHLGLEWDDRCLDHTGSKKTVKTASIWQVRQPIYTSSVAKWKHYEKQLQPMIKAMGSCVSEYDAELAALPSD